LRPDWITRRFKSLVARLDLPPVRLHDVRHGAATLAGAAGVAVKVIQHDMGHASAVTTVDIYQKVFAETAHTAVGWSGGSEPGIAVNPAAVAAMAERGIDITGEYPKPWTDEVVRAADVVISMGCGDACPIFPGKRYLNWDLEDPAGQDVAAVRPIRDEIERRVRGLLDEIDVPARG
jgi:protein-tyrosine-phosphatase